MQATISQKNLHLVVVGPVNGEETLEQVKALYGEMDKPDAIKAPEVPSSMTGSFLLISGSRRHSTDENCGSNVRCT